MNVMPANAIMLCALMMPLALLGCGSGEPDLSDGVEHFLAAQEALSSGDTEMALKELTLSIQLEPDGWAYYQRAKIYSEMGKDKEATADCEAGLKLDPDHAELKWLLAELHKPTDRRFQGRNANPPTAGK